jgi:C1A family cysteine protease
MYNMYSVQAAAPLVIPPSHNRRLLRRLAVPLTFDLSADVRGIMYQQSDCNACYAITAAEHLTFVAKRSGNRHGNINAQSLFNCIPTTNGCRGGIMDEIWSYGGPFPLDIPTGTGTGTVVPRQTCIPGKHRLYVDEYIVLSDLDGDDVESELADALVQYGPIPVAVDASSTRFHRYSGGVLTSRDCNQEPNHAVLLTGYTPKYWIVKNSWGTDWGEEGFARIARNKDVCGIGSYASFVTRMRMA